MPSDEVHVWRASLDRMRGHLVSLARLLSPDERVELIRGVIREMSPKKRSHVIVTKRLYDRFVEALAGRASVYKEDPLRLSTLDSEPEPDVLVQSNPDVDAYGTEATRPLLVVEVAEASVRYDLGEKAALYAEAGIPEYWVVNLVSRVLEVFREPQDGTYRVRFALEPSARVAPQMWPDVVIEVASLFP